MASRKKKISSEKKSPIEVVQSIDEGIAKLQIAQGLELQKALTSNNIDDIYKAQSYIAKIQSKDRGNDAKSMLFDPQTVFSAQGYRMKSYNLSYEMLRAMGRTDVIKPIVATRLEQVINFCEPQKDRYSTGFVIRPKKVKLKNGRQQLTPDQERKAEYYTEFILNCGTNDREWHGDNFHSFTRKVIPDSLIMDQGCFEVLTNRKGTPIEMIAVDGATFRIADSYNNEKSGTQEEEVEIDGYKPYYVQVYQGRILAEFYPWELCFGIRNPQTSIFSNGYGRAELEDLIENVTAMLNTNQYNANYFKVGSNPKGIIKVSGNINPARMEEFKNQWFATMAGVKGAHKMPIIEADKMDFINTQASNKDMEYVKYYEFLIKIACAHFKMDPSEIGFTLSGSGDGSNITYEGNNEKRLEHSKDKGLKPLLKQYQHWLNKWVINRLDPEYEIVFMGLDADDPDKELDRDIKAVQYITTPNEIRRRRGEDDIEGGDQILNPIIAQQKMMTMQMNMGAGNGDYQEKESEEVEKSDPIAEALSREVDKFFEIK